MLKNTEYMFRGCIAAGNSLSYMRAASRNVNNLLQPPGVFYSVRTDMYKQRLSQEFALGPAALGMSDA
jgi:hypothetical protein